MSQPGQRRTDSELLYPIVNSHLGISLRYMYVFFVMFPCFFIHLVSASAIGSLFSILHHIHSMISCLLFSLSSFPLHKVIVNCSYCFSVSYRVHHQLVLFAPYPTFVRDSVFVVASRDMGRPPWSYSVVYLHVWKQGQFK